MNSRVPISIIFGLLAAALFLAAGWAYWKQEPAGDAWIVEQPERIVSRPTPGEKLRIDFVLRNTSSRSLRILGVEVC